MTFSAHLLAMLAAAALPPAPVDGIRDDAHILSERAQQTMVTEMKAFTERTGLRIFLDTNTFLESSTNARIRAKQLLTAWSGEKAGVLVCMDRTSQEPPGIQVSDQVWKRSSEPEVLAAIDEASVILSGPKVDEVAVVTGLRSLMEKLVKLDQLAGARTKIWRPSDKLLAGGFLACVLIGGLITLLVSKRLKRTEGELATQHYFPDVSVGQRFGAPFGGGVIVEVSYRREI